jgi:hypothetical protein
MTAPERIFLAQTITAFSQALDDSVYSPVSGDTWIAVTDVEGSTKAIAQGRYKQVNLAGAAGIAALSNAFQGIDLPFTFGGDGAIVLIPHGGDDLARTVLASLEASAQSALGLTLRTALVPINAIRDAEYDVRIVYQNFPGGRSLPMFCGGGIAYAESLAKSAEGAPFRIPEFKSAPPPNLDGLSCRWQPLRPQRGLMLSILVQGPNDPAAYLPVFDAIALAAAGPQSPLAHPPIPAWPPWGLRAETNLAAKNGSVRKTASILVESGLAALSDYTGWTIAGFNGRKYRNSLVRHCDAIKFADGLKMVVDCSPGEADAVEAALMALPATSGFEFGLQRSDSALMTCLVQTTADGGHVHFVDGAQGGYAIAAQSLKNGRQTALTND